MADGACDFYYFFEPDSLEVNFENLQDDFCKVDIGVLQRINSYPRTQTFLATRPSTEKNLILEPKP